MRTASISANTAFLVLIGALSVLGMALMTVRLALSTVMDVPAWLFPSLLGTAIGTVWLFPSIMGRTVTALLARRVGFLSLRLDSLHVLNFKNLRAEGIYIDSPSLGRVRVQSLQVKPNWKEMFIHVEVSNVSVEMSDNNNATASTPASPAATARAKAAVKKKSPPAASAARMLLPMLSFLHHVQINFDYVEVRRAGATCRVRDFTTTLQLAPSSSSTTMDSSSPWHRLLARAGLGMLTVSVDPPPPAPPPSSLEAADPPPPPPPPPPRTRLPPLLQINHTSAWLHVSASVTGAELADVALPVAPQPGCGLSVGLLQVSANSDSLLALKRAMPASSSSSSSAAAATATPTASPPFHPLVTLVEPQLAKYGVDPATVRVDRLAFDWYSPRGVCVALAANALDVKLARTSLAITLNSLLCTSGGVSSSTPAVAAVANAHAFARPMVSLDSIRLEVLDEEDVLQVALVLHRPSVAVRPSAVAGLERAHVEWLRYTARAAAAIAADCGPLDSSPPPLAVRRRPPPFQGIVEFVVTGGVALEIGSCNDSGDGAAHGVALTVDSVACKYATVEEREKYVKLQGVSVLVDRASALHVARGMVELSTTSVAAEIKVDGVRANVAVGAVLRAYRVWLAFLPRIEHWQDAVAELRASAILLPSPPPSAPTATTTTTPVKVRVRDVELNALFGMGGKGVRCRVPSLLLSSSSSAAKAKATVHVDQFEMFALDDGDLVSVLHIQSITAEQQQPAASIDVIVVGTQVCVPAYIGGEARRRSFAGGDILQAYFRQRKALRIAMKQAYDEASAVAATAAAAAGGGGSFVRLRRASLVAAAAASTTAPPSTDDNNNTGIDKHAFSLTFKQCCIEFEDDDLEDRAGPSFFPTERRRSSTTSSSTRTTTTTTRNILTLTCPLVSMQGDVILAWRSRVPAASSPGGDLALLKLASSSSSSRAHRTRAHVLHHMYEFDASGCPKQSIDLAFAHGFADLVCLELQRFTFGPALVLVSDYAVPMLSFDSLDMPQSTFVFADLQASPSATTQPGEVVLGELTSTTTTLPNCSVMATSSLAPVKLYFSMPKCAFASLRLSYGECVSPALFALDRALGRAMPASSDKASPKLGWWDKMRYMAHGRCHATMGAGGLELRMLTKSPWLEDDCILVRCASGTVGRPADDDAALVQPPPTLGIDQRMWDLTFEDYTLHVCRTGVGGKYLLLALPKVCALFSFAWQCQRGGDHYVQLHHPGAASASAVADQYAHFRAQSLDVGLDHEITRKLEDDFAPQDRCPIMYLCAWRQMYPVLCACQRGIFPPRPVVAAAAAAAVPTLGQCLTKITFNVRCSRPHIAYWEDDSAAVMTTAYMMRGKHVDSQVVLGKTSEGRWEHERVLSQFFAVEAFILASKSKPGGTVDFERDFGMSEAEYCFGVSLPHEPFFVAPSMRLTLGSWTQLVGAAESQALMGGGGEDDPQDDSTNAYILCVDGSRMRWTLRIRDDVSRFFATMAYIMRRETRLSSELAQQFASSSEAAAAPQAARPIAANERRMDLSLLFNRSMAAPSAAAAASGGTMAPSSSTDGGGGASSSMSSKMHAFLHATHLHPVVSEDTPQDSAQDAARRHNHLSRDRPSACSTADTSADLLKSTWEESSRTFTLELRRPQICLQSERNVMVLASRKATMRTFMLGLMNWTEDEACLLRKEVDVEVSDGECFATVLGEGEVGTRCIATATAAEVDERVTFQSARGCVRRGASPQQFLDAALVIVNKQRGGTAEEKHAALEEARTKKRLGGGEHGFYDITSLHDQDPHLERIGGTDRFQATNITYTDTSGGAKVPSSHLGVKMRTASAALKSKEFFAVLAVLRNLLLEGPPPDVKELSILTQQEAVDELKRRWLTHHPTQAADKLNDSSISPAAAAAAEDGIALHTEAELKAHVERVCAGRLNAKRLRKCSQRIIYELDEFNITFCDQQEERIHSQSIAMRGDHSFAPDGSTKVEFELGDLKVFDLQSQAQIVECQLLESYQSVLSRAPFLRADAMTSQPINVSGYRVTVYELIQVHLFPGTRYRFRTRLSQSTANFVRKYLTGEDDLVVGGGVVVPQQHQAAPKQPASAADEASPAFGAARSPALSSTSLGGGGSAGGLPQLSSASTQEVRRASSGAITASSDLAAMATAHPHHPSDSPRSTASNARSSSTGQQPPPPPLSTTSSASSQQQPPAPLRTNSKPALPKSRFSLAGLFSKTSSTHLPEPAPTTLEHHHHHDDEDEDDDDDEGSFHHHHAAPPPPAVTATARPAVEDVAASGTHHLVVRTGAVTRLSVPKSLQQRPEPTVQPWNLTVKRRNYLQLAVRSSGNSSREAVLELHRSELGMKMGVPPRTSIRVQDIYRIQRHVFSTTGEDGAPEGAVDVYYYVEVGPMTCQGVLTWCADEPGWSLEDKALPWIAALAPGLGGNVLNQFIKQELRSPLLEPIWRRSAAVMGRASDAPLFGEASSAAAAGGGFATTKKRPSADDVTRRSTGQDDDGDNEDDNGEYDDAGDGDDDEDDSEGVRGGGGSYDEGSSQQHPPSRRPSLAGDGQEEEEEEARGSQRRRRRRGLRHQQSSSANVPSLSSRTVTASAAAAPAAAASEPQRREINFFKYLRVGQIQVELTLQGFPFVNNLQRNAYSPAEVYHSQLWTWYRAFKIVQRYEVLTLLTSYLRGGSGANWEDNTHHPNPMAAAAAAAALQSPPPSPQAPVAPPAAAAATASTTGGGFFKRRTTAPTAPAAAPPPDDSSVPLPPHHHRERRRSDAYALFGQQDDPAGGVGVGGGVESDAAKLELLFGSRAARQHTRVAAHAPLSH